MYIYVYIYIYIYLYLYFTVEKYVLWIYHCLKFNSLKGQKFCLHRGFTCQINVTKSAISNIRLYGYKNAIAEFMKDVS